MSKLLNCPACKHKLGEYTPLSDKYDYIFTALCTNDRCGLKGYSYKDMKMAESQQKLLEDTTGNKDGE